MDNLNPESYFNDMERVWRYLQKVGSAEQGLQFVKDDRGYGSQHDDVLKEAGMVWVPSGVVNMATLKKLETFPLLGLERVSRKDDAPFETGKFLLEDRVVFPVRSVEGRIFAFIGWYPDQKKYITTPSALFSKDTLFFGLEQLGPMGVNIGGKRFRRPNLLLVEGIFDSLSLRTLGVENAVVLATMGSTVSGAKKELYRLFHRIIAIPDRDGTGRKNLRKDGWSLPVGSGYVRIRLSPELLQTDLKKVKDIDDVVVLADRESLRGYFEELFSQRTLPRYVDLTL